MDGTGLTRYGFNLPNLPRDVYQYLKQVREAQHLSPWQVVVLALMALELVSREHPEEALELVERVKREHPQP